MTFRETIRYLKWARHLSRSSLLLQHSDVFLEITPAFKIRMMTFGTGELLNHVIVIKY